MKLVILDRDGVINHDSDAYIKSPDEWRPIEGSLEAIGELTRAGVTVVVATNQSGIARGLFDLFTLARIHQKMVQLAEDCGGRISGVFFCPHGPDEDCQCRKPRVGLFREIENEFELSLQGVPYVGDSLKDIQAARAVGCVPVLVKTGKGIQTLAQLSEADLSGVRVFSDLHEAVQDFLAIDRP